MQDNIIQFKNQKIFKNANLINIETGEVELVDILIEDQKISKIAPVGKIVNILGDTIDLKGDYVMTPFVNAFCDSVKSLEKTYGLEIKGLKADVVRKKIEEACKNMFVEGANPIQTLAMWLMFAKNIMAGASFIEDVSHSSLKELDETVALKCVENLQDYSESELDEIVQNASEKKTKLFLKIGQSLDELGTVDKIYRKPISQVLEDFGFLDRKPIIVGGNCLEKDELQLLKQYDCKFVVCPSEDGKLGRRLTNLKALQNLDFEVTIGSGYSFEIDFFGYMRQILMHMRSIFEDKEVLTEQDVLKMATNNSFKIQEGKMANFIVIKREISLYDDIFKKIVWEKSKKDVVMTVRNGEILQKNGEILMKKAPDCDTIKMLLNTIAFKRNEG